MVTLSLLGVCAASLGAHCKTHAEHYLCFLPFLVKVVVYSKLSKSGGYLYPAVCLLTVSQSLHNCRLPLTPVYAGTIT